MSAGQVLYASLAVLGVMTYIASLILPESGDRPGFFFLVLGGSHLADIHEDPFVALAWLANPLVVAAWIFSFQRMNLVAIGAAFAALTLSGLFLLGHEMPVSEAGGISPGQHGIAYDFWVASMAIKVRRDVGTHL